LGVGVAKAELDLILMESVSIQELLIALQANLTTPAFIRIVFGIRPGLILTLAAISLGAKLAVLNLFG